MVAVTANLDFQSEQFKLFFIYESLWYFLLNFQSIRLSVQENKFEINFQDGDRSLVFW